MPPKPPCAMPDLDRRLLLQSGFLGLAAVSAPGAAQRLAASGFTHAVASGEPTHRSVMLWTRYVPSTGSSQRLEYQVSRTPDFSRIVADGAAAAEPERDYCARAVADGLDPGAWYFYRFVDSTGRFSPVGRTRTLPVGPVAHFKIAVFSCANLGFGWFNAYAHAAARQDIDLVLHLGDYLYEYPRGEYPAAQHALSGRDLQPASETVSLADYRLRHAAYRAEPDLQRLHQLFPMVAMWDDHESANDSWKGGAENHQPETEGDWEIRKAAAVRAFREWLPISDEAWESYQIGDLATLFRPETRLTGRTEPLNLGEAVRDAPDLGPALLNFRDGPWLDPSRTMLGFAQEEWLAQALKRSVRARTRWQVLGQQVIMGSIGFAPEIAAWLEPTAAASVKQRLARSLASSRIGLPFNFDMWDGYPAARRRLLRSALEADANLVVLSGDSHNAWAFDLDLEGTPAGVDLAVQSVTSPGYEFYLPRISPEDVARSIVRASPQLRWAETSRRGYMTLELTPERATGQWLFLETVKSRSSRVAAEHRLSVRSRMRRFS
ncbi:MAG: alkaline phosphatase D family protein [Pseudomonadota bacterium]|nr:alkaline phosphatase D family protein [Pseudomonadota bacterium]